MRKFLILLFAALIICLPAIPKVSAEQAAAEQYRQLINSGKFFIEYGTATDVQGKKSKRSLSMSKAMGDYNTKRLAYDGDRKMLYSMNRMLDVMKHQFSEVKRGNFLPTILYQEGKYYQFYGKDSALVGYEEEFSKDYINPNEAWDRARAELNLPNFLVAILPDNPNIGGLFNAVNNMSDGEYQTKSVSELVESGTANIFGQTFNYDKYLVKNFVNGQEFGKNVNLNSNSNVDNDFTETYTYYYDTNGVLKYIKEDSRMTRRIQQAKQEYNMNSDADADVYVRVESFTKEIPAGFFNFPVGCKVYKMDLGTLQDLLEIPQLVETH